MSFESSYKPSKAVIKKLRKLQDFILEEPKRFNLSVWGEVVNPDFYKQLKKEFHDEYDPEGGTGYPVVDQKPPCGTTGCIAGDACVLFKKIQPKKIIKDLCETEIYSFPDHTDELAAAALGIPLEYANRLFYLKEWSFHTRKELTDPDTGEIAGWPEEFADRLAKTKPGTKAYAKVAVARIEHFIQTGE